jgi:hypothetical protein
MSRRRARLISDLGRFMQQYQRPKGHGGYDPNDRNYDRDVERAVKRMDPKELDELLRGDTDDPDGVED